MAQGDSGGPLWRHVKEADGVRAVQVGVVSRGESCANLNYPALFGSVQAIYPWIQQVVQSEMREQDFCPSG